MKDSGYSAKFRREIIESGMKGYEKQVQQEREGIRPLHRPKGYMETERRKKKKVKKAAWYRPHDTVLFCPPTPNGELATQLRKVAEGTSERALMKIKVVERAGVNIICQLPGLKENKQCDRQDCLIHRDGGKGDCKSEGVVYKGACVSCKLKGPTSRVDKGGNIQRIQRKPGTESVYYGESGRSGYQRGLSHVKAISNPKRHNENAFAKHINECHNGDREQVKFKVDVVRRFKRPLERQIWEGVEIHNAQANIQMNSKLDHYQPAVSRVIITNQL